MGLLNLRTTFTWSLNHDLILYTDRLHYYSGYFSRVSLFTNNNNSPCDHHNFKSRLLLLWWWLVCCCWCVDFDVDLVMMSRARSVTKNKKVYRLVVVVCNWKIVDGFLCKNHSTTIVHTSFDLFSLPLLSPSRCMFPLWKASLFFKHTAQFLRCFWCCCVF